jgi:hypothetical protein
MMLPTGALRLVSKPEILLWSPQWFWRLVIAYPQTVYLAKHHPRVSWEFLHELES